MSTYKDPTAWAAIANVMREDKRKPKTEPPPKHGDTVFYIERKGAGGGKHTKINEVELNYQRLLRAIYGANKETT